MKTGSDIDSIKELLIWSRENEFALHRVQVGAVVLDVSDVKPQMQITAKPQNDALDDLYEEMGQHYGVAADA